jgi:uncharacterized membrane protein YgcG
VQLEVTYDTTFLAIQIVERYLAGLGGARNDAAAFRPWSKACTTHTVAATNEAVVPPSSISTPATPGSSPPPRVASAPLLAVVGLAERAEAVDIGRDDDNGRATESPQQPQQRCSSSGSSGGTSGGSSGGSSSSGSSGSSTAVDMPADEMVLTCLTAVWLAAKYAEATHDSDLHDDLLAQVTASKVFSPTCVAAAAVEEEEEDDDDDGRGGYGLPFGGEVDEDDDDEEEARGQPPARPGQWSHLFANDNGRSIRSKLVCMEQQIIQSLGWEIARPTVASFLQYLLDFIGRHYRDIGGNGIGGESGESGGGVGGGGGGKVQGGRGGGGGGKRKGGSNQSRFAVEAWSLATTWQCAGAQVVSMYVYRRVMDCTRV